MLDEGNEVEDFECIYLYQDQQEEWILHPDRGLPLDPIPTRERALIVCEREYAGLPVVEGEHPRLTKGHCRWDTLMEMYPDELGRGGGKSAAVLSPAILQRLRDLIKQQNIPYMTAAQLQKAVIVTPPSFPAPQYGSNLPKLLKGRK